MARYLLLLIFVSVTVLALEDGEPVGDEPVGDEVGEEVGKEAGDEVGEEVGEESDNNESVIDWAEVDYKLILDSLRIDHRDHTYADINSYRTLYQSLHLTVDMEDRTLSGFVETTFVKIKPSWMMSKFSSVGPGLVLDIGPHVTVTEVEHVETGEKLEFTTSCVDKHVVSVLQCALQINDPMESVGQFKLRIHYSVTDKTSSLHFIPPLQTHSKDKYFLVSNTQPSNARGWIPCQDTPALKFPYHATIRVKEPFTVLMSAIVTTTSTDESGWVTVGFRQEIPTPPYLIAITVADIVSVDVRGEGLGTDAGLAVPPIRVWGEKSLMEKVGPSGILDLIPRMMDICERKYGRYEWLRYDIVLNPPGYMFRGMEFPAMNYISSTVLNFNDLTGPNYIFSNIIAHEMIHSWFGNLVTPKYAGDAWLAEGITSFEELELMEEYYEDPEVGKFLRKDRYTSLKKTLESYTGASAKYKILTPYLFEDHPFHGFTYIHYNKGSLFLEYLANHTSREKVDQGLRSYLDSHRYQSVDTADFVHMLYQQFGFESAKDIEREIFVWLERPSTKVPVKLYQSEIFEECSEIYKILTRSKKNRTVSWKLKDIAEAYDHRTGLLGDKAGHVHSQMMIVLERMKTVINRVNMTETRLKNWKILLNRLDKTFKFSEKTESDPEMFAKWASIALRFNHTSTMSAAPVFFAENARLELVFSLLDAPVDFRLRGVFANILRTSYDTTRYPGYIGSLLTSYAEYFIGFYEP